MEVVITQRGVVVEVDPEQARKLIESGVAYCPDCDMTCESRKLCDKISTKGGGGE